MRTIFLLNIDNIMQDWGDMKLIRISSSSDFWNLIDELTDDESEFLYNRNDILDSYSSGNLYGLEVEETDEMYKRGAMKDKLFCKNSCYLLPCFCIKNNDTAVIIWTHSRARRNGLARRLIELLGIKKAYKPLAQSKPFWKSIGIEEV